ncbi:MAG: hypothetical protein JNL10_18230 [Verrucomicrobiales bacterium]|nr:hypothetical protein [Verrucomicrobiales bacterium]
MRRALWRPYTMHRRVRWLALAALLIPLRPGALAALPSEGLFARTNLVAWCIVPFDTRKRTPEQRAELLEQLGVKRLAYDWRSEHVPTFDAEIAALDRRGIELTAWWFPAALNDEARAILDCLRRHGKHPQLWVTMGTEPEPDPARLAGKINGAVETLGPICDAAAGLGSTVALYNHLGWFGEPTNQVVVIQRLRAAGHTNVGSVYNFHHAHAHIDDFAAQLALLKPHLLAVNLNGMVWRGDQAGRKIIPLGTGDEELRMMRELVASGWKGPVGILGHTEEDAGEKLRKELAGLERLAPLASQPPGPPPVRTPPQSALPAAEGALVGTPEGTVLDARVSGIVMDGLPEYRRPPFTVEARVRLAGGDGWNILAASESKASPTHWELYTFAGAGDLSFYAPGMSPDTVRSGIRITDGAWHEVAVDVGTQAVALKVDGREVARRTVAWGHVADPAAAPVSVGRLVEGGLGCDGWIAWVRLRKDAGTSHETWSLAPWTTLSAATPADAKRLPTTSSLAPVAPSHPVVGARRGTGEPPASGREPGTQAENDWVDNRWQETDIGPFLASNLRLSSGPALAKGLTVKVGDAGDAAMAYDTATASLRAAWTGGFLKLDPARFGLIGMPRPAAESQLLLPATPAWGRSEIRMRGWWTHDRRTVLEYTVDGVKVREMPWADPTPVGAVFFRDFAFGPRTRALALTVASNAPAGISPTIATDSSQGVATDGTRTGRETTRHLWIRDGVAQVTTVLGRVDPVGVTLAGFQVDIPAGAAETLLGVAMWTGPERDLAAYLEWEKRHFELFPVAPSARAGAAKWAELRTTGQRGADTDFLAVDTLTLPYDNPWKALLFASGVDLAPEGAAYVCTIHGDVWRVTGIDDALRELRWKRFATGLFQPLGLKVRDGEVFVLGRDRITRLRDTNGDGEADFHESFFDGIATSTGGHDYVTCLETDSSGNFYYVDPAGVHRVSADGRSMETLATGFRNPNGMGVSPDGRVVTVAPQQGTWTPSSFIAETHPGGYYGYGGPKVTPTRPLGYDTPLCWIPHSVDNSSGSQVWVPAGHWDALGGQMLHLLWGRCGMMLALRDTGGGGAGPALQGAVVPLPVKFLSGPNRGSFHPKDGSLFVAGSTGWQTSAVKDGSLQRVRFTGKRMALPVGFRVRSGGLEVTFSIPVDRATAEDPGSYGFKQWNYRYAEAYGSKDWSVANPDREGRDEVAVKSVRLQPDGRTVSVEIPGLQPVMQWELRYNVDAADHGRPLRGSVWGTINAIPGR